MRNAFLYAMTHEQIARELGVAEGTVVTLEKRALAKLALHVDEHGQLTRKGAMVLAKKLAKGGAR